KKLRNAIAWFDESLVDFGDFNTALTKGTDNREIKFSFRISNSTSAINPYVSYRLFHFRIDINQFEVFGNFELSVSYQSDSEGKNVFVKKVTINLDKIEFEIESIDKNNVEISIDGRKSDNLQFRWVNHPQGQFLPSLILKRPASESSFDVNESLISKLFEKIITLCGNKFSNTSRLHKLIELWDWDKATFLENIKTQLDIKTLKRRIGNWTEDEPTFIELHDNIFRLHLFFYWDYISQAIAEFYDKCDYVAPLRAEANRYYRNQGLQIDRIDPYGRNISEFIDSLTLPQKASYNEFVNSVLKVKVNVKNNLGNQSIVLSNKDDESNIVDVGFGYSQILPIITKLWYMQQRRQFRNLGFYKEKLVMALIEQPELHLHPALQAKLADIFIKTVINNETHSKIMIETHSPTIINRIGRRIMEGHISSEDVSVLVFDKDSQDGITVLNQTSFDEKGRIKEWPFGFFDPENDEF
ncbi:MAG: DUF3696 domain-containing protein, partial [Muribaculum sp.]|nr:DUF3696 domain-containing protein [Muribaculum sp.]